MKKWIIALAFLAIAIPVGWYADTKMPRSELTAWFGFPKYKSPPGAGWHDPETCARVPRYSAYWPLEPGAYGMPSVDPLALENHGRASEALIDHAIDKLPFKLNLFEQLVSLTGYRFRARAGTGTRITFLDKKRIEVAEPEDLFLIKYQDATRGSYKSVYQEETGSLTNEQYDYEENQEVGTIKGPWIEVHMNPDLCTGKIIYDHNDRQFLADQANLEAGRPLMLRTAFGGKKWVLQLQAMVKELRMAIRGRGIDWRSASPDEKQQILPDLAQTLSKYDPDVAWFGRYLLDRQSDALMAETDPDVGNLVNRAIAEVLPQYIDMQKALVDHAFARMVKEPAPPALILNSILDLGPIYDAQRLRLLRTN